MQKYRDEMARLFKDFEKPLAKSENILNQINRLLPEAQANIDDLKISLVQKTDKIDVLISKADSLCDELETIIISGNRLSSNLKNLVISNTTLSSALRDQDPYQPQSNMDRDNTLVNSNYYKNIKSKNGVAV
ncbi:MAG: hypothetical protein SFT93_03100 [Rickettsiaceae bacterium]|nr:hypothetical protein [Rickettsiaceae bacterium]